MTRSELIERPKLSARDKALATAIDIIRSRAAEVRRTHDGWCERHPDDSVGAAIERAAYLECELLARLISERMSPAGIAALKALEGRDG